VLLPENSVPEARRAKTAVHHAPRLFGIRPEHLQITAHSGDVVKGSVEQVEFQGAESFVYVSTPQQDRLIVRADNTPQRVLPRKGDAIGLTWLDHDCHVFDADSGIRLSASSKSVSSRSHDANFIREYKPSC